MFTETKRFFSLSFFFLKDEIKKLTGKRSEGSVCIFSAGEEREPELG